MKRVTRWAGIAALACLPAPAVAQPPALSPRFSTRSGHDLLFGANGAFGQHGAGGSVSGAFAPFGATGGWHVAGTGSRMPGGEYRWLGGLSFTRSAFTAAAYGGMAGDRTHRTPITLLEAAARSGLLRMSLRHVVGTRGRSAFRDTVLMLPDSTTQRVRIPLGREPGVQYTDAEVGLAWQRGPVALEAWLGGRLPQTGGGTAPWIRAGAQIQLSENVAFDAGAGGLPSIPEAGLDRRAFINLGINWAWNRRQAEPSRPVIIRDFRLTQARGGTTFRVVAPGAHTVEIAGDFSDWLPVALHEGAPQTWLRTLFIPPGTWRIGVRIDGGTWLSPPGLPAVADEFGGSTGVFEVTAQELPLRRPVPVP